MNEFALDLALHLRLPDRDFRAFFAQLLKQAYFKPASPARITYLEGFAREHGHADLIKEGA
jgi:hypothetical protein